MAALASLRIVYCDCYSTGVLCLLVGLVCDCCVRFGCCLCCWSRVVMCAF